MGKAGEVVDQEGCSGPVLGVDGPAESHQLVQDVWAGGWLGQAVPVSQVLGEMCGGEVFVRLLTQRAEFPGQHAPGPLPKRIKPTSHRYIVDWWPFKSTI